MKTFIKFTIAFIVMLVVTMAVSPYYQLYRFKVAYEQGDYTPIISSINYENFRPNLKRALHDKLKHAINQQRFTLSLLMLGAPQHTIENFTAQFIDEAVDKAITPDNLTQLSYGNIDKDSEPLLMGLALWLGRDLMDANVLLQDYLTTGDIHTAFAKQESLIKQNAKQFTIKPTKPDIDYCGINCFLITTTIKNQPITIKMHRYQLIMWQIDDILLP